MARLPALIGLTLLLLTQGAGAADLRGPAAPGRFRATCEDLGTFCFADACGGDQIAAAEGCRARCPSASIVEVVPAACPLPDGRSVPILRRRG
ncbi:hypothetical protein SAMN02799625_01635 [Methylobacterium sp. UNC300MFChir4.1]|jgi:hypothetical protein|uniref:hypothetical protein n=1 Tax=unclassified Methylobacterium TaxID=2615210 RepID=UPI0008BCD964|nr:MULTISPECIES: hypothetical protein [unclassified Methylobacterium]SEN64543.1 hypothetical protein SAMN02799625_01635 [Methylobacterium sp. UNC300MFChir4.1]SFD42387.1 hypothetical protein SAMN02799627_00525 [Methylobacterium sp. 13MFTsu3.1M2]